MDAAPYIGAIAGAAVAYGAFKHLTKSPEAAGVARPENVGILAMEAYFPRNCLPQTALEAADGCEGKYTVGLGQEKLAYFDDREDIGSILLTALARLMEGYGIKPEQIGRLEVGTETLVDKSKSVKTTLLAHLFGGCADVRPQLPACPPAAPDRPDQHMRTWLDWPRARCSATAVLCVRRSKA